MTNRRRNRFPIGLVNLIRIFNKHKLIFLPWPMKNNSVAIYLLIKLLKMMRRSPTNSDGQRLREALTELGPVYIKLGQLLSTRSDIFGANVASELALLQDHVPPAKEFDVRSFINSQQFDDQGLLLRPHVTDHFFSDPVPRLQFVTPPSPTTRRSWWACLTTLNNGLMLHI